MIQVINRALDILEYIAKDPESPRPLGEIASDLNLNAGTCANIIKTMVDRKYLDKLGKQKGYCLGSKAYELTGNAGYQKDLVDASREQMELLTSSMNENSLLCVLKGDIRSVIYRVQSKNYLQANTATEKRAYDTASGRLLLAMMPEPQIEKFIEKYGPPATGEWDGVTDLKSLLRNLKKIKSQGYAIQTTVNQIVGIALPVYKEEKVIAALSVYMPSLRFNNLKKVDIIRQIKKASEVIGANLS
ncbi:IclR family transcriptional regulator [Flavitalea antarctica]